MLSTLTCAPAPMYASVTVVDVAAVAEPDPPKFSPPLPAAAKTIVVSLLVASTSGRARRGPP